MSSTNKKIWFRAKRYGWGWGLPCSWQGWVVMVGYIALIVAGAFVWGGNEATLWYWIGYVMGLTALLIIICAVKGEKPRWRWGGREGGEGIVAESKFMRQVFRYPTMKGIVHRLWLSLLTGYIFLYYGEIMFWATPDREGMNPSNLFLTWLLYSVFAYVFLCVVAGFRARSPWAVFLAAAVFGWFEEGIIMQTTYGSSDTPFPISISFTGLAWHALIDALVGWYVVRKVLAENRPLRMAGVAALIGAFYGFWAVFWWTEPPEPMRILFQAGREDLILLRFGGFALVTTALFIGSLWLYNKRMPRPFAPSKAEQWILGLATLAYYGLVTIPNAPKAIWVLPPLLGLTFLALNRNRGMEDRPDAIVAFNPIVGFWSYLALMVIPVVASAIYFLALAADARPRSNLVVFYATSVLGVGLWITSVWVVLCRSRISG